MLILGYVCLRNLSKFRWRNNVLFKVSVDIHVKNFVSSIYGGEHVAIPHPATSSFQLAAPAAIGSKINVRNSSELYKIVRHEF